jgi:hypothetical protein
MINKLNWTTGNLMWVAGLLEGEGSFGPYIGKSGTNKGQVRLRISCAMTDEDVIRKLHAITGFGSIRGPIQSSPSPKRLLAGETGEYKPIWVWESKNQEEVYEFELEIFAFMGERRKSQILNSHEARRDFELNSTGHNIRRVFS